MRLDVPFWPKMMFVAAFSGRNSMIINKLQKELSKCTIHYKKDERPFPQGRVRQYSKGVNGGSRYDDA